MTVTKSNNMIDRFGIGFDELFNTINSLQNENFPPHNILKFSETSWRITLAVAGFSDDELEVSTENQTLTITGNKKPQKDVDYVYRGIANRSFSKTFKLAEHVNVVNGNLENGLLHVDLEIVVPEAQRRKVLKLNN